ncbi:DUF1292 domain-containing protein [Caldibacillus thermolactis]|uniref:DUF1292 domain-containing protein n=2 Tax=Pallidibacillus thermolactis TaxID=251051 RepID=A0ABT2WFF1_9BACI|nr:DUF1292 domain-containing protein [Pallidibacillus thermolactis]MCU9594413.1 DUF1292 domain-containing protein [Pallidibacillus thermolactis]MCU9601221.1 DUF1292 domain-containing protein [Pallidibacillus thermolactis subsp. kokeshiiformis]MED1672350.1 DUF1292 domain-containing protein [Pallidibacillus thermolactis subsp. kokeshiiformis]
MVMEKIEVGEIFSISDDVNEEHDVEVIATLELEGTQYVAVSFVEDLEDETNEEIDLFFLKIDEEGDIAPIGSDDEFDKVSKAFDEILDYESDE